MLCTLYLRWFCNNTFSSTTVKTIVAHFTYLEKLRIFYILFNIETCFNIYNSVQFDMTGMKQIFYNFYFFIFFLIFV